MMIALATTFVERSYWGEADLAAIAHLINTCKTADHLDGFVSAETLEHDFADPEFNPNRDVQLWEEAGHLIGYAGFSMTQNPSAIATDGHHGWLFFYIHPDYRNSNLGQRILNWAEQHIQRMGREWQLQVFKVREGLRDDQSYKQVLLTQAGFTIDRYFYRMQRSLLAPIPQPELPAGFTIRALQGVDEVPAWNEMFNQSFVDHWSFEPETLEYRLHWMQQPTYEAELDQIAIAPDGTFAAFSYSSIDRKENARAGCLEGWVNLLGTRRGFRQMGLGRAMLLTGLYLLKARGMETALLGVDSENPSGALRLYQSVGFQKRYTFLTYGKEIEIRG
jgi:mycothiol synthase